MSRLTHRQYSAVLACLGEVYSHHNLDTFGMNVLKLVHRLAPGTYGCYNEFNVRQNRGTAIADPPDIPVKNSEFIWSLLAKEHPSIQHHRRTGDGSAHRLSDFLSRRRLHETALYREFFRHYATEFQLVFYLPERPPNSVAISLVRDRRDFSEAETLMMELLRPHLFQAYRNAEFVSRHRQATEQTALALEASPFGIITLNARGQIEFGSARARRWLQDYFESRAGASNQLPKALERWMAGQQLPAARDVTLPAPYQPLVLERPGHQLTIRLVRGAPSQRSLILEERRVELSAALLQRLGLTARQAEVLVWIAQGKTNPEIGTILGLSAGTVHKHAEHIYQKLSVETRTAAAARAWETVNETAIQ